jgi:hemoglobin
MTTASEQQPPPTVFAWAGGSEAFSRLTRIFYGHVKTDPILAPVFAEMSPEHPEWVAQWLGEVFGGPATYTKERGGYAHMVSRHLGRALTEQQRARWVRLMGEAADEAGLPADPEFRSAFVSYLEWGSRLALANSQPAAQPPPRMPVPRWDWGTAGPPSASPGSAPSPLAPCATTCRRPAGAGGWLAELRARHPAAVHRPRPGLDGLGIRPRGRGGGPGARCCHPGPAGLRADAVLRGLARQAGDAVPPVDGERQTRLASDELDVAAHHWPVTNPWIRRRPPLRQRSFGTGQRVTPSQRARASAKCWFVWLVMVG